jgi:hypothetical protein
VQGRVKRLELRGGLPLVDRVDVIEHVASVLAHDLDPGRDANRRQHGDPEGDHIVAVPLTEHDRSGRLLDLLHALRVVGVLYVRAHPLINSVRGALSPRGGLLRDREKRHAVALQGFTRRIVDRLAGLPAQSVLRDNPDRRAETWVRPVF